MTPKDILDKTGNEIFQVISTNVVKHFGSQTSEKMVGNKTRRLINSVIGIQDGGDRIRTIVPSTGQIIFTFGTRVPYASLQEVGGVRVITERMRNFFWRKFKSEGEVKWKWMALSKLFTFKPRPFLLPGGMESRTNIIAILRKNIGKLITAEFERNITGTPKAVPLNAIKK